MRLVASPVNSLFRPPGNNNRAVDKEPGWNVAVRGLEGFFWRVWQFPDVLTPCQFIF
jgi:hypothetical protein